MKNIKKYNQERFLCIFGIFFFGTASALLSGAYLNYEGRSYPLFLTEMMFFGEFSCFLFIFYNKKSKMPFNCSPLVSKFGDYCFFISGFFEFISALLESISASYLNFAFYVTLKMLNALFILIHRKLYINRSIYKHQKLGIALYLIGMIIIIFEALFNKSTIDSK